MILFTLTNASSSRRPLNTKHPWKARNIKNKASQFSLLFVKNITSRKYDIERETSMKTNLYQLRRYGT